ncbi:hypothetical protein [Enterococcus olivae]
MKKLFLFAFFFGLMLNIAPVGYADTVTESDVEVQALFTKYRFLSYPPKTYHGKTLVRVDTYKTHYDGWYL